MKSIEILRESIETPLKIIEAQGFEANQTTVSFTPHDFENNRTSLTLYVSGNDVFEIKEGLIHKTTMPAKLGFRGKDYGELASIIGANPNWFQIPNQQQLIDNFNRTYGNPFELPNYPVNVRNRSGGVNIFLHHSFAEKWRYFYRNKFSHVYNELFKLWVMLKKKKNFLYIIEHGGHHQKIRTSPNSFLFP